MKESRAEKPKATGRPRGAARDSEPLGPSALVDRLGNRRASELLRRRRPSPSGSGVLQAKLRVGEPKGPHEKEADRAASAAVQRRPVPPLTRTTHGADSGAAVGDGFAGGLGPHTSLAPDVRAPLESAFGRDLGHVRVHEGPEASRATRALGARALTVGADVALGQGEGKRAPSDRLELFAHEVAHVVQQEGGAPMVARQVHAHSQVDESPVTGRLYETLLTAYASGLTAESRSEFETQFLDAVDGAGVELTSDIAQRTDLHARAQRILAVAVADTNTYDVLGGLATLDRQAGVEELGTAGASMGASMVVRLLAEYAALWLHGALDPQDTHGPELAAFQIPLVLSAAAEALGSVEGRYKLELEGTVLALLDARSELASASPQTRAAVGARIGQLARRALLLDAALDGVRTGRDAPPEGSLDTQMVAASGRIAQIRQQGGSEADTVDALGDDAGLLTVQNLSDALPDLQWHMEDGAHVVVPPEEALPETTDAATVNMLQSTVGALRSEERDAEDLHDRVIPKDPEYTPAEFSRVFANWLGFFSPDRERRNPLFQLMAMMFDPDVAAETQHGGPILDPHDREERVKHTQTAYGMTGIPTGLGSVSGAAARWYMFRTFVPMLENALGGAQTQFGAELDALQLQRDMTASGRAGSPRLDSGGRFLVPWGQGTTPMSPRLTAAAQASASAQRFTSVAQHPSTGPDAASLNLARLFSPRPAPTTGVGTPILGLHTVTAEEGWSYLVDVDDPLSVSDDPVVAREHRVVRPEAAAYITAREALRREMSQPFVPHTRDGAPIGDFATRTRGLEFADAQNAARQRGEPTSTPRGVLESQAAMADIRGRSHDDPTSSLIVDLEHYLDDYFAMRPQAEYRFAAVMTIANQEHGVGAQLRAAFSPEHLLEVAGKAALLGFGSVALEAMGPVGRIAKAGIDGYMVAHGCSQLASAAGVVLFLRGVAGVSNFRAARAWGFVAPSVIGDLSNLIDMAISEGASHAGGMVAEAALQRLRGASTPRQTMAAMGDVKNDPAAKSAMLAAIESELASATPGSKEYRELEAMQVEVSGRPATPAIEAARDEALSQPNEPVANPFEFARPRAPEERAALEAEIPPELRGRVRIVEDPLSGSGAPGSASGTTVGVVAMNGEVQIRVGRNAGPAEVRAHIETARDLSRFTGPLGRLRQLADRLQGWLDGHPAYRTRGAEAAREVEKLGRMIEELRARQEVMERQSTDLQAHESSYSPEQRAALDADILSFERQLMLHSEELGSLEAGRGVVAARDARATVRDALGFSGMTPEQTAGVIQQASEAGQLDALADLASTGLLQRLLRAGMTSGAIVRRLMEPEGYRRLITGATDPTGRAAGSLGWGVAAALRDQRAEAVRAALDRNPAEAMGDEWGIDPTTGEFTASRLPGDWTVSQIEARARDSTELPRGTVPEIVYRRWRYMRRAGPGNEAPFEEWVRKGYQANVNRGSSSPLEVAAVEAIGATNNNASAVAGGQHTYDYYEWVDRRGRYVETRRGHARRPSGAATVSEEDTRPDGIIPRSDGFDVVDHKDVSDESGVLEDSIQLRAQREMARVEGNNGRHIIVMTSQHDLVANPNLPTDQAALPQNLIPFPRPTPTVAQQSTVLYMDARTGMITHEWIPGPSRRTGWRRR